MGLGKNIEWESLSFGYIKTDCNIRSYYKDGQWGAIEKHTDDNITMSISSTCLHYGQECFEGLKAFKGADGKIRLFRVDENAKRMNESAKAIMMPEIPEKLFIDSVVKAVEENIDYVPPYGTGASLYIRPMLIGTSPQLGVYPSTEYLFAVFVVPVGPYFKDGFKPVDLKVERRTDRAAPQGTGNVKVGGNYAASMRVTYETKEKGFSAALYLDPKEKKYIDECGPANFFGIKDNTYITPQSESILPSITNMSLVEIAKSMGLAIERRKILIDELSSFQEVGACGTAAVVSPVGRIFDLENDKVYEFCKDEPGEISVKLYNTLQGIQNGTVPDEYGWNLIIG